MKIKKILIANRGEIASRIIRTCKKLNIETVAIFSDADQNSVFVKEADFSFPLGESQASESYLNISKILTIAIEQKVDAIHPGYGFLSENYTFAKQIIGAGVKFIGPDPESIFLMGDKIQSRNHAVKTGLPIIPGYDGDNQNPEHLLGQAERIGFPVIIKASAGGGGKGMKRVDRSEDFFESLESAKREAKNFFSNETVFIEKYILNPRHIEIQIFGDTHGNVISLLERDCSVQRRHQKIIEECPAPNFSAELRKKMSETAIQIGKSINYVGAGTVEFILDQDQKFYFMEMNTRLQVEHPVTEMVTGLDLVELQIQVANGEKLNIESIEPQRHSIEARIYAEDPENNFLPSIGKIVFLEQAKNIRIDSGIEENSNISIFYDPMISKVISIGKTREDAIENLQMGLKKLIIFGCITNTPYLQFLLEQEVFQKGNFTTSYIDTEIKSYKNQYDIQSALFYCFIFMKMNLVSDSIHSAISGNTIYKTEIEKDKIFESLLLQWKNTSYKIVCKNYSVNQDTISISIMSDEIQTEIENAIPKMISYYNKTYFFENGIIFKQVGVYLYLFFEGIVYKFQMQNEKISESESNSNLYKTPMPGKLTKLYIKANDKIKKGDLLAVVEAMKMENPIKAFKDGEILEVYKVEGSILSSDEVIFKVS